MRCAAAIAVLAFSALLTGCGTSSPTAVPVPEAAGTQRATLGWVESTGSPQSRLVFRVRSFSVTGVGWSADVSVANDTAERFSVEGLSNAVGNAFGLMLFRTGTHDELEQRNKSLTLPALRPAMTVAPALPTSLAPRSAWTGTVTARGALPSGLWVRLVFGTFVPDGAMPESLRRQGVRDDVIWITDHTYRLLR